MRPGFVGKRLPLALVLVAASCGAVLLTRVFTAIAAKPPADRGAGTVVQPEGVRAKLVGDTGGARTYELVLAPGTEALGAIADFVTSNRIESAHFEGLGACTDAVVGYWDAKTRDYRKTRYDQQMEIVSLIGDAAPTEGDGAGLHVHVGLGFQDGTMHGGHLFEAHASPTLELVLTASPTPVHRRLDEASHAWLLEP
jgi:predicted DNA-binding protein with PD1-like motif